MTDPSLAVAALGVGPEQLLRDLKATGLHFEGLVVRDLRIYAQPIGGQLSHWRDNNQHVVDIIITLDDGRWGALEVKMNPDAVGVAAASLLRFKDTLTEQKASCGVVYATVAVPGVLVTGAVVESPEFGARPIAAPWMRRVMAPSQVP